MSLGEACRGGPYSEEVKLRLAEFASLLEASRFFSAEDVLPLLQGHPVLQEVEKALEKKASLNPDERRILHGFGVAYEQAGQWKAACAALEPLIRGEEAYLPAVPAYLVAKYHVFVRNCIGEATFDQDTSVFIDGFQNEIHQRALKFAEDIAKLDDGAWSEFGINERNARYYSHAFHQVLGIMLSIVAELSSSVEGVTRQKTDELFAAAEGYLRRCCVGRERSERDTNNLADLYKQMGDLWRRQRREPERSKSYYEKAETLLNAAIKSNTTLQPILYRTLAETLWGKGDRAGALLALQQYTEEKAERGERFQVREYVENQIYAAKLLFNHPGLTAELRSVVVIDVLERLLHFVRRNEAKVGSGPKTVIHDMLGQVYLETSDREGDAVLCLNAIEGMGDNAADRWRRKVLLARARIRLSRWYRRHQPVDAARERRRAEFILDDSARAIADFDPTRVKSFTRRIEYVGLHLDTLSANLELAEETFYQGAMSQAARRIGRQLENGLFQRLHEILASSEMREVLDVKGGEGQEILERLAQIAAATVLLTGTHSGRRRFAPRFVRARGASLGLVRPGSRDRPRARLLDSSSSADASSSKRPPSAAQHSSARVQSAMGFLEQALRSQDHEMRVEAARLLARANLQGRAAGRRSPRRSTAEG